MLRINSIVVLKMRSKTFKTHNHRFHLFSCCGGIAKSTLLWKNRSPLITDVKAYLEIAHVALRDADLADFMADRLDLSDAEMLRLREQLHSYMEDTPE